MFCRTTILILAICACKSLVAEPMHRQRIPIDPPRVVKAIVEAKDWFKLGKLESDLVCSDEYPKLKEVILLLLPHLYSATESELLYAPYVRSRIEDGKQSIDGRPMGATYRQDVYLENGRCACFIEHFFRANSNNYFFLPVFKEGMTKTQIAVQVHDSCLRIIDEMQLPESGPRLYYYDRQKHAKELARRQDVHRAALKQVETLLVASDVDELRSITHAWKNLELESKHFMLADFARRLNLTRKRDLKGEADFGHDVRLINGCSAFAIEQLLKVKLPTFIEGIEPKNLDRQVMDSLRIIIGALEMPRSREVYTPQELKRLLDEP